MNLLLHLPPETEALLMEQARATGRDVESLALEALREKLGADQTSPLLPRDVWKKEFREFLATSPDGNPDADFGRDGIYDGRGE
jgi:hypothetical protein